LDENWYNGTMITPPHHRHIATSNLTLSRRMAVCFI